MAIYTDYDLNRLLQYYDYLTAELDNSIETGIIRELVFDLKEAREKIDILIDLYVDECLKHSGSGYNIDAKQDMHFTVARELGLT